MCVEWGDDNGHKLNCYARRRAIRYSFSEVNHVCFIFLTKCSFSSSNFAAFVIQEGISSREFGTYVQHKIDVFTQKNFIKELMTSSFIVKSKPNFMAAFQLYHKVIPARLIVPR